MGEMKMILLSCPVSSFDIPSKFFGSKTPSKFRRSVFIRSNFGLQGHRRAFLTQSRTRWEEKPLQNNIPLSFYPGPDGVALSDKVSLSANIGQISVAEKFCHWESKNEIICHWTKFVFIMQLFLGTMHCGLALRCHAARYFKESQIDSIPFLLVPVCER